MVEKIDKLMEKSQKIINSFLPNSDEQAERSVEKERAIKIEEIIKFFLKKGAVNEGLKLIHLSKKEAESKIKTLQGRKNKKELEEILNLVNKISTNDLETAFLEIGEKIGRIKELNQEITNK